MKMRELLVTLKNRLLGYDKCDDCDEIMSDGNCQDDDNCDQENDCDD